MARRYAIQHIETLAFLTKPPSLASYPLAAFSHGPEEGAASYKTEQQATVEWDGIVDRRDAYRVVPVEVHMFEDDNPKPPKPQRVLRSESGGIGLPE